MLQIPFGADKFSLDTPALCIELDTMESNIDKMADYCRAHQVQWRPHSKCHKTPAIALRQIAAGAIGTTCPKTSEAEVMAQGGVRDILIANMVVGEQKLERIAAMRRWSDPIIACDHYAQVEPLAAICRKRGVTVRVLIEVDIGLNRVGVRPGQDTLELAQAIDKLQGVELAGLMGYEGHLLTVEDQAEKEQQIRSAINVLTGCADTVRDAGIPCDIVSAGGTGSYQITAQCAGVTELQAGGGIFMDPFYRNMCQVQELEYALTVLASVVSRPSRERAVLDCGRKTMNPDVHLPVVAGDPATEVTRLSAEHCELKLTPDSKPLQIGDKVELVVGYGDFTTVLHDQFYGFRNGRLETVWPILGRGKLQ